MQCNDFEAKDSKSEPEESSGAEDSNLKLCNDSDGNDSKSELEETSAADSKLKQ